MKTWRIAILLALLCLGGCVGTAQTKSLLAQRGATAPTATRIPGLPFFPQDDYQCGPAALATVLRATAVPVAPEDLVPLVYVPGMKGSFQIELVAAARSFGRLVQPIPASLDGLLAEVDAGHPVLVLQNLALSFYPQWHFAVVKGYDLTRDRIILNSGEIEDYELALGTFARTWQRADNWGIVVLTPGALPASGDAAAYFQALASLLESGASEAAARAVDAGLERWPDDRGLRMSQGNQLYAQGQLQRAATAFAQVVASHPDYAPAYNNLAHVQTELGLYAPALANINRALVLEPPDANAYRQTQRRVLDLLRP